MYTVGIKRRFWFGFKKVRVQSHGWENGRVILNLEDGSQEQIAGFRVFSLKVYNDFHRHYQDVRREQEMRARAEAQAAEAERKAEERAIEILREMKMQEPQPEALPQQFNVTVPQVSEKEAFERNMQNEVLRRATQRVNDIFS